MIVRAVLALVRGSEEVLCGEGCLTEHHVSALGVVHLSASDSSLDSVDKGMALHVDGEIVAESSLDTEELAQIHDRLIEVAQAKCLNEVPAIPWAEALPSANHAEDEGPEIDDRWAGLL